MLDFCRYGIVLGDVSKPANRPLSEQWGDLFRRMADVHPEIAARALVAVTGAVEVFEANSARYPGQTGLKQSERTHLDHAEQHVFKALRASCLGHVAKDEEGDGLPDMWHALCRLLFCGKAEL